MTAQPSSRTLVLLHNDCLAHAPREGHQESPERVYAISQCLKSHPSLHSYELAYTDNFPVASRDMVIRAHSAEYFDLLHSLCASLGDHDNPVPFTPAVQRGLRLVPSDQAKSDESCDTSFSKGSLQAALRAGVCVFEVFLWLIFPD